MTKLLGNNSVKSRITHREPEILEHFKQVVKTVSMEEAVLQQLDADGELEENYDSDNQPLKSPAPIPKTAKKTYRQYATLLPNRKP